MIFEVGDTEPGYQLPKIDPEENWEDYREDLTTNGELDLQKVKEFAAHYEWASRNNTLLLARVSDFSKPHTHASWVAEDVAHKQRQVVEWSLEDLLIEIEVGDGPEDIVREYIKFYREGE